MKRKPVADQIVVVMGASSRIGRATALAFAREGARLVVSARGPRGLESLVAEIQGIRRTRPLGRGGDEGVLPRPRSGGESGARARRPRYLGAGGGDAHPHAVREDDARGAQPGHLAGCRRTRLRRAGRHPDHEAARGRSAHPRVARSRRPRALPPRRRCGRQPRGRRPARLAPSRAPTSGRPDRHHPGRAARERSAAGRGSHRARRAPPAPRSQSRRIGDDRRRAAPSLPAAGGGDAAAAQRAAPTAVAPGPAPRSRSPIAPNGRSRFSKREGDGPWRRIYRSASGEPAGVP